jgi:UDP:flavonoid glycosyltransferase YjiC (YdhE family)
MRFLVAVMPIAGHVAPVTGLVAELLARGHEVRVYTGSRYVDRFVSLGADTIPWSAAPDFDEHDLAAAGTGPLGPLTLLAKVKEVFLSSGSGQVRDLSAALDRRPADLLVSDVLSIGVGLLAELRDLPWAGLNLLALAVPSRELPPPGLPLSPAGGQWGRRRDALLWRAYRIVTSGAQRAYNDVRAGLGLSRDRDVYGAHLISPWLLLATGGPALEEPRTDLPEQVHFVGRLAPVPVSDVPGAPELPSSHPRVIVTQGTHHLDPHDLLVPALEGLRDLPVDVVATTGRPGATDLGVPVPPNARVVDFLDFSAALPGSAVLVTNGGWGGILEALAAGVPLVVAGGDIDKPGNAVRVARAGAGVDLRTGRPSPAAVAAAVTQVLDDPRYAERARSIGAELAGLGGAVAAADLLEELVRTRAPVRRVRDPWRHQTR